MGASETNEVKVGAFATKKNSTDSLKPSDAGISVDEDFLDLFNLEKSNEEQQQTQQTSAAASPAVFMSPKSTDAKSIAEKSSAKKAIFLLMSLRSRRKKVILSCWT